MPSTLDSLAHVAPYARLGLTEQFMRFLEPERRTLEQFLPGLSEKLGLHSFNELEANQSPAIALFREHGGPGLLIPKEFGGAGATALQAVQIQRAVGSCAPSLAVASTMHHFSVATLVELCVRSEGPEWMILEAIAKQQLLVASGFAEGQSGRGVFATSMRARVDGDEYVMSGSKKPCSLSRSMDFLTVSLSVENAGREAFGVALIPASTSGLERRSFWNALVLTGAESDEVVLQNVRVPSELVYLSEDTSGLDEVGLAGLLWFELLISASYLGIASGLVGRVIASSSGDPAGRMRLVAELEAATSALEAVAGRMMSGETTHDLLVRSLFSRYAVQDALERACDGATEVLGGIAFITEPEVASLLASVRALAFHPPSRRSSDFALDAYMSGKDLELG